MKQYNKVKLIADKYAEDGANIGDIGYIIEIYQDGNCEVEFSNSNTGISYAQVVVKPDEILILE